MPPDREPPTVCNYHFLPPSQYRIRYTAGDMAILDIIVDLQYGDCGKGKVAHYLTRTRGYTHVLRYNGGANAVHTIFHKGKKFITHQVPAGGFFGVRSVLGAGGGID